VTAFVNGIPSPGTIINISAPAPTAPFLAGPRLTNGVFQFIFTNSPGALFTGLMTTNVSLSLSNWTVLGGVVETSPGHFQFTDPEAANNPQRFYRILAP